MAWENTSQMVFTICAAVKLSSAMVPRMVSTLERSISPNRRYSKTMYPAESTARAARSRQLKKRKSLPFFFPSRSLSPAEAVSAFLPLTVSLTHRIRIASTR